jgi:ubiquinone/menaquinone biosynthesis C-methylase UbiE
MNFFSSKSAAGRYYAGRPYYHPLVIERIRKFLSLDAPLARALDVGCGTGFSTIALKEIAREIVGVDASAEMVALAEKDARIEYFVATASQLPFAEDEFELITISQAFHWLDREKFLREAARALRTGGWLVVYDNYFSGELEKNAGFQTWYREDYLRKYPPPPRTWPAFTAEDSENEDFRLMGQEYYQNSINFSVETFVDYLVTQSNVIAQVEYGAEEIDEVRRWLIDSIKPLFGETREASFLFNSPIWYLQLYQGSVDMAA